MILASPDRARALDVLAKVRARGHHVLGCDASAVVRGEAMVSMRDFRFSDEGLGTPEAALPWDDVLCLLRAMHRRSVESKVEEKERKFSAGKALVTGGMAFTSTKTKEKTAVSEEREQVLYVFRKSGASPWLLRETATRYVALGSELAPTATQNFLTTLRVLRAKVPGVPYDERLMTMKARDPVVAAEGGIDFLAHLTAMALRG